MSVILYAWAIDLATAQSPAPQTYRITAGDKIGVTVFGQPDLSGESTVDQSGNLRLPIVGDIYAVNLTLGELEKSIAHSLEQGYVRNPTELFLRMGEQIRIDESLRRILAISGMMMSASATSDAMCPRCRPIDRSASAATSS
jgi:Polysaccharide biosynthesis/export protein